MSRISRYSAQPLNSVSSEKENIILCFSLLRESRHKKKYDEALSEVKLKKTFWFEK